MRVAVPDAHVERTRWLATRDVRGCSLPRGSAWEDAARDECAKRYIAIIHPFATQGVATLRVHEHEGALCTEVKSGARLKDGREAALTLRDCPGSAWWKDSVQLALPEGMPLWEMQQLSAD